MNVTRVYSCMLDAYLRIHGTHPELTYFLATKLMRRQTVTLADA